MRRPELPIPSVAAALVVVAAAEVAVAPRPPGAGAVVLALAAPLLLLLVARRPVVGFAAVAAAALALREAGAVASPIALVVLVSVAAFVAGALAAPRGLPVLAAVAAAYIAVRVTQPHPDAMAIVLAAGHLGASGVAGALVGRALERAGALRAEVAGLRAAIDDGPSHARSAEQLRVWRAVKGRIDDAVSSLPWHATGVVAATREQRADDALTHLAIIRAVSSAALEQTRRTVHELRDGRPVAAPHTPPHADTRLAPLGGGDDGGAPQPDRPRAQVARRLRAARPLDLACGLLLVAAAAEQLVLDLDGGAAVRAGAAVALAALPRLAALAPVAATAALGGVVVAASGAGVLGGLTITQNFAMALALIAATTHRDAWRGLVAAPAGIALMLVALRAEAAPWPASAFAALALQLAAVAAVGVAFRRVAAGCRVARADAARLGAELRDLEEHAVLAERVRVAHDLHDLVGHALVAIAVQAGAATALVRSARPEAASEIDRLAAAVALAAEELDRFGHVLGVDPDGDRPGSLRDALQRAAAVAAPGVTLAVDGDVDGLAPALATTVLRVVQEALTNARKHAGLAPVEVAVDARAGEVVVRVENAPGAALGVAGTGHGLRAMRERVAACGGSLAAGPRAGGGWSVTARLPTNEDARAPDLHLSIEPHR